MLHYRSVGDGKPLVIVHGLFGSGDNWQTLAGKFPGRRVFLPDLRNHGNSPWFDGFSVAEMARDLVEFSDTLRLGSCPWVGHSLGGRVVMELALRHAATVQAIAVLDMTPAQGQPRYQGFVPALRALDLTKVSSRSDAQARLEASIDLPTLQFLLKSLVLDHERPGRFRWRLNLESLDRNYPEIWKALSPGRWDGPALFLCGGESDYVGPEDEPLIRTMFPQARLLAVPGAGHWLHAEKPAQVLSALDQWLKELD